jgi:hypothetical protein
VRVLCSSIPSNDLGLPSRLLPVALELRRRGHEVAFSNPASAPAKLISGAGFENLPWPLPRLAPQTPLPPLPSLDADQVLCLLYRDPDVTANEIANWKLLIQQWGADAVLDSFGPTGCAAARMLRVPQVQNPPSRLSSRSRFTWWLPPQETPSPVAAFNAVLEAAGLPPVDRASRLLLGEATVVVGSLLTDPVPDPNLPVCGSSELG